MAMKVVKRKWADLDFWRTEEWGVIQDFLRDYDHRPDRPNIFRALALTPLKSVKVVVLGQDPYHTDDMADGLAFSLNKKHKGKWPPSLINIMKEYKADLGLPGPKTGDLSRWAKEGVLLINTIWTVEPGKPKSHHHLGWQKLTQEVLEAVAYNNINTVFHFWGESAREYSDIAAKAGCILLETSHPSPYSAHKGFLGSKPFSRTNEILIQNKERPINWELR